MQSSLFAVPEKRHDFDKVPCDKCHTLCEAVYLLSKYSKGLWVNCPKHGRHAIPYREGFHLRWKPSKPYIREVGLAEAEREADALSNGQGSHVIAAVHVQKKSVDTAPLQPTGLPLFFTDAGTKNNGVKGKQETIIVVCDSVGKVILEKWIGDYSNNEGEIVALISCLKECADGQAVEIRTDSRIASNWTIRGWTIANEKTLRKGGLTERHKQLIEKAHQLFTKLGGAVFWIPREENLAGHYIERTQGL